MERAPRAEDFAAARHGRYFVGRRFLVWSFDAELGGGAVWGTPDEDDAIQLERALGFDLEVGRDPPFDVVLDASRLRHVARPVYERFLASAPLLLKWIALLHRRAIVASGPGLTNSVVFGTASVIGWGESRHFESLAGALEWLGRPELAAEIDRITLEAIRDRAAVLELREWLDANLRDATLGRAARTFGRSARALQRELRASETSFRAELERARVDRARTLLRETDTKLAGIASEIGCRSPSAFAALFGRVTGESPSAFRARHRG
jgi:AraC-like DNA-binding protein